MHINEQEVYTTDEAKRYLKVSQSTMMRMIKSGLIHCAKVGKQYRIMGKELLRLVSPKLEDQVGILYNKGRRWVHDEPQTKPKRKAKSPKGSIEPSGIHVSDPVL